MDTFAYTVLSTRTLRTVRRSTDPYRFDRHRGPSDHPGLDDHEDRRTNIDTIADSTIHADADSDAIVQECVPSERGDG